MAGRAADPPLFYQPPYLHVQQCAAGGPSARLLHRPRGRSSAGSRSCAPMPARRRAQLGIENIRCNAAGCLDRCEFGPNMVIYPEGVWYRYEITEDIDEILETHVKNGGRVERLMLQPDQLPPKH